MKKILTIVALSIFLSISNQIKSADFLKETVEISKIMGLSISAAVVYGIINDQITSRMCPEYFTEGFHKEMILENESFPFRKTLLTTKSQTIFV